MPTVLVWLDNEAALAAFKRTLHRSRASVRSCRSPTALTRILGSRVVDGLVLGTRAARRLDLGLLRQQFPAVPLFLYGTVRSDEADQVLGFHDRFGVQGVLIEGVDDPIAGEVVARSTVTAKRRAQVADWPRFLRLTEPLQLQAFGLLVGLDGKPPPTRTLADRLEVSREHLSRRFGAGGAPNLKRVISLLQIVAVRDLLQNPGLPLPVAARLFGYSTPSHLRAVVRRVLGLSVRELLRAPNAELLKRFVASGTRSRAAR